MLFCLNNVLRFLIGKTLVGIDRRSTKPLFDQLGLIIHLKNGRKGVFFLVGTQRTGLVGQHFREHGNHTVHQIYRCSPIISLFFQNGIGLHIMGNIRNMDAYFIIAVFQFLKRKCIIKILGILGINGKGQYITHIPSLSDLGFLYTGIQGFGVLFHLIRKFMRKSIFRQNGMDFRIMLAGSPQHLHNFTIRGIGIIGPIAQIDQNLVSIVGLFQLFRRDKNISIHSGIGGANKSKTFLLVHNTHVRGFLSFQYPGDFTLLFLALAPRFYEYLYRIAMECFVEVVIGHKNIVLQLIDHNIGIATTGKIYPSGKVGMERWFLLILASFGFHNTVTGL